MNPDLNIQERAVQEQAFLGTAHNRGEVPIGARRSYHREGWIAGRRYEAALAARKEPQAKEKLTFNPAKKTSPAKLPKIAVPAREAKEASLDTDRPDGGDPVLPDGVEEPIASLHNALAILSLILLRAKTEPHRADRDRVRLLRFFSGEDTERPDELTRALAEFHDALGDERGRGNAALRLTLHKEEHEELLDELSDKRLGIDVREPRADEDVDRTKLARELADVVYISYGTAHAFAIDLDAALREIHRAAMSKLDPATMVVREDGKIMKPHGFVPPDMSAAVRDTEQEPEQ